MKRDTYKSAVDKLKFDEQLDNKIMDYLSENTIKGEYNMKKVNKRKMGVSIATAACSVLMISGVAYAAVMNFKDVSHMDYGLAVNNETSNPIVENKNGKIKDTSAQREEMSKEDSGYKLISEEMPAKNEKWIKKTVWKDMTTSYNSNDGENWGIDNEASIGITTNYAYKNYEDATKDAKMPNIMNSLRSKVKMNKQAFYEEFSTEGSSDISGKQVSAEFEYKKGKIHTELYNDLSNDANSGISVITGVNEATNQREYMSKEGIKYKLSDNTNDDITKTTTLVSNGSYSLVVQFENLSDDEIHIILDNLDLSQLDF
ncbi:hypothetical protein [Romboutsia sp. 1001713B170131_170501_G6]|uniref:hypothetical protein n=1 Tax=Romboutsia sp. 1001713B170131_170501_G6 TaxID=2787108 RepID=UPI0018A91FEE|nr:hypothetical protein [Romboutsia sp. 1001713B170131_170501_G6]